jgi:queuosine precursor transporter
MTSGHVTAPAHALKGSIGRSRLGRHIWRSLLRRRTSLCVCIYLGAMVAANASVLLWGPAASILNAFFLVGLDLATRDALHEAWSGPGYSRWALPRNMALLLAAAGMLSWLLNRDAGRVAAASFVACGAAGVTDTLVYQGLRRAPYTVRANGSNLAGGFVDSLLFPLLAFGAFLPFVMLGQWAAKIGGGALWSWAIGRWREREA